MSIKQHFCVVPKDGLHHHRGQLISSDAILQANREVQAAIMKFLAVENTTSTTMRHVLQLGSMLVSMGWLLLFSKVEEECE